MESRSWALYRDGSPCIAHDTVRSSFLAGNGGLIKLSHVTFRKTRQRKPAVRAFAQKMARSAAKVVTMVDPIEAKRLAVEQMKQLEAKAKFKRQRSIEAINGGWAMLGITACLVIEGYTGKSLLSQIAGYLHVLADFFDDNLPSLPL